MSAEWIFFIFSTVGTLAIALAPDAWQKAIIDSRFGQWLNDLFTAITAALESAGGWLFSLALRVAQKVSRG